MFGQKVVLSLLLIAFATDALDLRKTLYDVCIINDTILESSDSCIDEPPCRYCVNILSQNSVYRVSDVLTHSGLKWFVDAETILREGEYNRTFLYEVLKTNGIAESSALQNLRTLRTIIHARAEEVLSEQDKLYMNDPQTLIIYLRMGDRIDHIPIYALVAQVKARNVTKVVFSFVLHFGEWAPDDFMKVVKVSEIAPKAINAHFSFHEDLNIRNYEYLWDIIRHIKAEAPHLKIIIRSNINQDEDLALYVVAQNFVECGSCGGFEKIVMALRNSSEGILEHYSEDTIETQSNLTSSWFVLSDESSNYEKLQFVILNILSWILFGFEGVSSGTATHDWNNTPMGAQVMGKENNRCKLTITRIYDASILADAVGAGNKVSLFLNSRNVTQEQKIRDIVRAIDSGNGTLQVVRSSLFDEDEFQVGEVAKLVLDIQMGYFKSNAFSPKLMRKITKWVELWAITDMCCSRSMSATWRTALQSVGNATAYELAAAGSERIIDYDCYYEVSASSAVNGNKAVPAPTLKNQCGYNGDISSIPNGTHRCQLYNLEELEMQMQELEKEMFQRTLTEKGRCNCSIGLTIERGIPHMSGKYQKCESKLDVLFRHKALSKNGHTDKNKDKNKNHKNYVTYVTDYHDFQPDEEKIEVDNVGADLASRWHMTNTWVQYGPDYNDATTQYLLMNVFGWYLFGFDRVVNGLLFGRYASWRNSAPGRAVATKTSNILTITRVTAFNTIAIINSSAPLSLFLTVDGKKSEWVDILKRRNQVVWVQRHDGFKKSILKQFDDYATPIFGITDTVVLSALRQWVQLWELTDKCCGATADLISSSQARQFLCKSIGMNTVEKTMAKIEIDLFGKQLTKLGSCECSQRIIEKQILRGLKKANLLEFRECAGYLDNTFRPILQEPVTSTKVLSSSKVGSAQSALLREMIANRTRNHRKKGK